MRNKGVKKEIPKLETGCKSKTRANVVIPGRGKVSVPVPEGQILCYKDKNGVNIWASDDDFTGWVKDISGGGNGGESRIMEVKGLVSKAKYLSLVRLGCRIEKGRLLVPAGKTDAVKKLLNGKE